MPRRWPCNERGRLSATLPLAFALNGADSGSESVCNVLPAESRTMTPSSVMASPVALTVTESVPSILGGTTWVTRGCALFAERTYATTGGPEPGWRLPSSDVAETVILPRIGALDGMRAVDENVTSRGLFEKT